MNGGEAPLSAQRKREHKKAFSRVEVGMEHVRSELREALVRPLENTGANPTTGVPALSGIEPRATSTCSSTIRASRSS